MSYDTRPIGKFLARAAAPGGNLYSGLASTISRVPTSYEQKHVMIEIYDPQFDHSELGQFIVAYTADTLLDGPAGGALAMNLAVPAWHLSTVETSALRAFARESIERYAA